MASRSTWKAATVMLVSVLLLTTGAFFLGAHYVKSEPTRSDVAHGKARRTNTELKSGAPDDVKTGTADTAVVQEVDRLVGQYNDTVATLIADGEKLPEISRQQNAYRPYPEDKPSPYDYMGKSGLEARDAYEANKKWNDDQAQRRQDWENDPKIVAFQEQGQQVNDEIEVARKISG